MIYRRFIWTPLFLVVSYFGYSQCINQITDHLRESGYQNIYVWQDSTLHISYENRVYRSEVAACQAIIEQLLQMDCISSYRQVELRLKNRNVEYMALSYEIDPKRRIAYSISSHLINQNQNFDNGTLTQSGQFRVELEVEPELILALGGRPDAAVHQVNLIGGIRLFLWKGATMNWRYIFPISDEFGLLEYDYVRPQLISFDQFIQLPHHFSISLSLGYFTNKRYGASLELSKWLLDDKLLIRSRAGYTGYASYPQIYGREIPQAGWEVSDIGYLDYSFAGRFFISQWDTRVSASYTKHLLNEHAMEIEVLRQFDELMIGLYGFKMDKGNNYGCRVSVPIYPKKYHKPGLIQVKPSRFFSYDYVSGYNRYVDYSTRSSLWSQHEYTHPAFIENQLPSIIEKN